MKIRISDAAYGDCFKGLSRGERDELRERLSKMSSEIQEYWKHGTRPSSVRATYDSDGEMIWNEYTGICGPGAWVD